MFSRKVAAVFGSARMLPREVDRAHRELPQKVKFTAFVPADGLNHKGDKVHFDAAGYRELGKRYAAAYLKLRSALP
jgi:lysophospholipase L1-like esterase